MKITNIVESTKSIKSSMKNSYIDFSKMTLSLVAVCSDVFRDGKRLIGYGFNSNGRYGQGNLMRERFIPRILGAPYKELLDANDGELKRIVEREGYDFDSNFQDYLAFELARHNLSRMNSIRGMSVEGGAVVSKLITLSPNEQEALNELFPRLKQYSALQLHSLMPQIAEVVLTEVQKTQKPKKQTGRFKR